MQIGKHWKAIQAICQEGQCTSRHFAAATVSKGGYPHYPPLRSSSLVVTTQVFVSMTLLQACQGMPI